MFLLNLCVFMLILRQSCVIAICPLGSIEGYNNNCYRIFGASTNWYSAEENCQTYSDSSYSSHLASILNAFENAFIQNTLQQVLVNVNGVWIGLNTGLNTSWNWSDNSTFNYKNWEKGQPNLSTNACVIINPSDGKWSSVNCSQSFASICKIVEIDQSTLTTTSVDENVFTTTPEFTTSPPPGPCLAYVSFLMDDSDCPSTTNIRTQFKFVIDLYSSWTISQNYVRINLYSPIGLNNTDTRYLPSTVVIENRLNALNESLNNCGTNKTISAALKDWYSNIGALDVPNPDASYPLILITSTSDTADVQSAISYRQTRYDPLNIGLIVISFNAGASNLADLASNGIAYNFNDPAIKSDISSVMCNYIQSTANPPPPRRKKFMNEYRIF